MLLYETNRIAEKPNTSVFSEIASIKSVVMCLKSMMTRTQYILGPNLYWVRDDDYIPKSCSHSFDISVNILKRATIGPPAKSHSNKMAFRWMVDGGPTLYAGLGSSS